MAVIKAVSSKAGIGQALESYRGSLRDEVKLNNLLSNAVKYTNEGSVMLSVRAEKNNLSPMSEKFANEVVLCIQVKDTGIGIRECDRGKLFQNFVRLDEKRNRNIEGTGLGLNLTRQLLDMMGGTIHVDSVYGQGSTFTVRLLQQVSDETPIGDFAKLYKQHQKTVGEAHECFEAPDACVLVADDMQMNLKVFAGLLKETKIQIDMAVNGAEALRYIQKKHYDVIFLDHIMPVMDGIEAFRKMKKLEENPNSITPVVMLTANAVVDAKNLYMDEGFSDYITKPISYRGSLRDEVKQKGECARDCGHHQEPAADGGRRNLPRRPLLPAAHLPDLCAAIA